MYVDEYNDQPFPNIPTVSNNLFSSASNFSNKTTSPSTILSTLSIKHELLSEVNNVINTLSPENRSSPISSFENSVTTVNLPNVIPPYVLTNDLVDQFNHYRNIDIISRIKQCDSNMKLSDMCETYSFDNHTYSLIRQLDIKFHSLQDIYDSIIDRMTVQKLNIYCPTAQWCLGNLTKYNIRFTANTLRQRGRSFCSLETCRHRLDILAVTCPSISTENISAPTLALLPMLCTLYKEQQSWNSIECTDQLAYLFHILYAFWSQLKSCYHVISAGAGGCTDECLAFDSILRNVENNCNGNALFLTRVPILAWYRLINLQDICRYESVSTKAPLISSIKSFISSNSLWYRFKQRPVYAILFLIIIICIMISFALCLIYMSNNKDDSDSRNFNDGYEYTRLHESILDINTNNQTSNRITNQSQLDLNDNRRLLDHQRLLYTDS